MQCSICEGEIDKKYMTNLEGERVMYWDSGHNAQPINNGRCCDNCNHTVVVPARFGIHFNRYLAHRHHRTGEEE